MPSATDPWMPPYPTLLERFWPTTQAPALRSAVLIGIGTLGLVLSAWANVPFWPVPLTLQGGVVLLLAALYGPRLGAGALAAYLALAVAGLPVLAVTPERGLGLEAVAGPTGGFLAGSCVAVLVVGGLVRQGWDRSYRRGLGAMVIGMAIVQAAGWAWLSRFLAPAEAWRVGIEPFLPMLLAQVALPGLLLPSIWWALGRRRRLV